MKYLFMIIMFIIFFAGCSVKYPQSQNKTINDNKKMILKLTTALKNLDKSIDKQEAQKVAYISTVYPLELANEYELVTPPLFHNTLINMELKKRGFCYHFAEDIAKELKKLQLKTLTIQWITHKKNQYWEHNALLLTANNQSYKKGIILDAWRNSGILYWDYFKNDTNYDWFLDIEKSRYFGTLRKDKNE